MTTRKVFRDDHEMFRDQVRRFVETEIVPHHAEWERDERGGDRDREGS